MKQEKEIKFTKAQVKAHIKRIEKIVKKKRAENEMSQFSALTPKEIEQKLQRVNSPMIIWQSWYSQPMAQTIPYEVGIYNPDPYPNTFVFAHVWVGTGNADPNVGTFLLNMDSKFPRLTEPALPGLAIQSGASASLKFSLAVPHNIERTNYFGNCCVVYANLHDQGTYYDRGLFVFSVL